MWKRGKFFVFICSFQLLFLVLFAIFGEYDLTAKPNAQINESIGGQNEVHHFYPMFQDVHVMMFIGFGFLMTFLKKYGLSSVGENMMLAAFVLQWATIIGGFLHLHDNKFYVTMETLLVSDFASAAVLISMGAMLGKASPLQYIIMAFFEIVLFQVNEWIGLTHFKVADVGGSIFVHVFGAYFGIACSRMLYKKDDMEEAEEKEGSVYHSDHFAMIGTVFLWLFWPSFNSAVAADGDDQLRAIINTYFCLAACCVTTFAVSSLIEKDKFLMEHIQNATLAGGVAIGSMADMDVKLWGAILIGMAAGTLSVLGYKYVGPFLQRRLGIHDTCGVNNLHGMPGIMAALGSVIVTAIATEENYGNSLFGIWSERDPENSNRSAREQAGYQAAALGVTLLIAIVGGCFTGLILRLPVICDPLKAHENFDDTAFWVMPGGYPGEIKTSIEELPEKKNDADHVSKI
ncbi:hypothetical protein CAPTEDRAFT_137751 [Capitella teleta]|uniref:Ammonium transporter AmtB-like domain-containing protein n=1 Tax=Capitella teleta TaxID=283909 RepID=R7VIL0_CAPTE|nr:hypothetical protein CAPTEDRAFT_137751 [Capitella teleta]|eukprot:ELU18387.1 hypothetical protein CAPTEDRAFT_137751 [Capitella teleta]